MDNNNFNETIGKKIKELRIKKGYTQEQFAEHLITVPQTVSNWERGVATPSLCMVPRICELLNCSPNDLLMGRAISLYPKEERHELIQKCISKEVLKSANALAKIFDSRVKNYEEFEKRAHEIGKERGVILLEGEFCIFDIDRAIEDITGKDSDEYEYEIIEEMDRLIRESGSETMMFVYILYKFGKEICGGYWELPPVEDSRYLESACRLIITDQDDYMRASKGYIFEMDEEVCNNESYSIVYRNGAYEEIYEHYLEAAKYIRKGMTCLVTAL